MQTAEKATPLWHIWAVITLISITPAISLYTTNQLAPFNLITLYFLAIILGASLAYSTLIFKSSRLLRAILYALVLTALITTRVKLRFHFIPDLSPTTETFAYFTLLLTLMIYLLHKHVASILLITFLTINLTSITLSVYKNQYLDPTQRHAAYSANTQLPLVIHIILDEHIGIDGIPTDIPGGKQLRQQLINFYKQYGFSIYPKAFSHYRRTIDSIHQEFNFTRKNSNYYMWQKHIKEKPLTSNIYFDEAIKAGYRLRIYTTNNMPYCKKYGNPIHYCHNSYGKFSVFDRIPSYRKKLATLFRLAYTDSPPAAWIIKEFSTETDHADETLFQPDINELNTIAEDLKQHNHGNLYLVHFLFPHYPYIYTNDCTLQPYMPNANNAIAFSYQNPFGNTQETRNEKYQLYFSQTQCLYQQLAVLFDSMKQEKLYNNAIIIIQSDHGSRISIHEPKITNKDVLTTQDLRDQYASLFAVKLPNNQFSEHDQVTSIQTLFQNAAKHYIHVPDNPEPKNSAVYVDGEQLMYPLTLIPFKGFLERQPSNMTEPSN